VTRSEVAIHTFQRPKTLALAIVVKVVFLSGTFCIITSTVERTRHPLSMMKFFESGECF
jgi:hypothetical protein